MKSLIKVLVCAMLVLQLYVIQNPATGETEYIRMDVDSGGQGARIVNDLTGESVRVNVYGDTQPSDRLYKETMNDYRKVIEMIGK